MTGGLFWATVGYHRLCRHLDWRLRPQPWAEERARPEAYPVHVASRSTQVAAGPLATAADLATAAQNLRLACGAVDGLLVKPGQVFSYCRTTGPGGAPHNFLPALEQRQGRLESAAGGGQCQLTNLLYLLALDTNAEIIERHRQSYDLCRNLDGNLPFGCGSSVFYNYVDFQFRNVLTSPLLVRCQVQADRLTVDLYSDEPLPFTIGIEETDHRFVRRAGVVFRENKLWRVVDWGDGKPPDRELLAVNCCRVMYPADDLVEAEE